MADDRGAGLERDPVSVPWPSQAPAGRPAARQGPVRRRQDEPANWLTAGAAIVGVLGIGAGLWWADGAAAIVISLDITRDGFVNVRAAVADLMDSRPTRYDSSMTHPLIGDLEDELRRLGWVKEARVRLRETGHVFVGETFVIPADDADPVAKMEDAAERLRALDWRIQEIVVTLVRQLDPWDVSSQPGPTVGRNPPRPPGVHTLASHFARSIPRPARPHQLAAPALAGG